MISRRCFQNFHKSVITRAHAVALQLTVKTAKLCFFPLIYYNFPPWGIYIHAFRNRGMFSAYSRDFNLIFRQDTLCLCSAVPRSNESGSIWLSTHMLQT